MNGEKNRELGIENQEKSDFVKQIRFLQHLKFGIKRNPISSKKYLGDFQEKLYRCLSLSKLLPELVEVVA
jgi:hypothetical protein